MNIGLEQEEQQDEYVIDVSGGIEPASLFPEVNTWDDMGIHEDILRSIYSTCGFEAPSEIQKKAVLPIKSGRDVIAQAQSGTGKTGAFVVGMMTRIDVSKRETQAIIFAPTSELVSQIYKVVLNITSSVEGLVVRTVVGGTAVSDDIHDLRANVPHIIVGCTGRVYDMINRRAINASTVRICILDEADEMLSNTFQDQICQILRRLPSDMQIALFSATMPNAVLQLTNNFMRDPIKIVMKPRELNLAGIEQYYIAVRSDHDKVDCLKDLFSKLTVSQTIIYANNVPRVKELHVAMTAEGFAVCCIHRDMSKQERTSILNQFREGKYRMLISSNLTARGIDVQQVNTVINFDIPRDVNTYLHRIGRSGRWGRKGIAINFVTMRDIRYMRTIESHYGISMEEMPADIEFY